MGKAAVFKAVLLGIGKSALKSLPNKTSQNSLRIQFALRFGLLLVFAWTQSLWVIPTSIFRTAEEQNARYQQGRTMPGRVCTSADGYNRKSKHQRWCAGDLLVLAWTGKKFRSKWAPREPYERLGHFWEALGGTWGGRWKEQGLATFDDPYHFEV